MRDQIKNLFNWLNPLQYKRRSHSKDKYIIIVYFIISNKNLFIFCSFGVSVYSYLKKIKHVIYYKLI